MNEKHLTVGTKAMTPNERRKVLVPPPVVSGFVLNTLRVLPLRRTALAYLAQDTRSNARKYLPDSFTLPTRSYLKQACLDDVPEAFAEAREVINVLFEHGALDQYLFAFFIRETRGLLRVKVEREPVVRPLVVPVWFSLRTGKVMPNDAGVISAERSNEHFQATMGRFLQSAPAQKFDLGAFMKRALMLAERLPRLTSLAGKRPGVILVDTYLRA